MRIALLQPPVEDFYQTSIRTQPVGLLYLAAALETAGHQVRIFDFLSSRQKQAIPFPKDFCYLKPHYHLGDCSPLRIFKHYYHYGVSWEAIEQSIAQEPFDVYGITCMFTPFQRQADRLAGIVRTHFPDRPIVAGGTHATSSPQRLLRSGLFDFVFLGEGEISFPRWMSQLQVSGKCGLRSEDYSNAECGVRNAECSAPLPLKQSKSTATDNGQPTTDASSDNPQSAIVGPQFRQVSGDRVESLDTLPFPARHLIDLDRYRIEGVRSTMLITSRGCPFQCTFCSVQQTMGHEFRVRSVDNVLREIEECVERYDIRHFDIEDDNFTFDERRAEQIMTAVLDRFGERVLRFSAMNGLTAARLGEPLLKRMRQAGFRQVNLSLVASQPQRLRELKRPVSFAGFRQSVEKAQKADLECVAYFILGLPGDNRRRMLETLLALAGQPVLVGPSVFYVSPGTELFHALSERIPENWDLLRSSTFYMESGTSTAMERITVFRLTRLINFLKERVDAGTWQSEKDEAVKLLAESQVAGRKSQVANQESDTGTAEVAGISLDLRPSTCDLRPILGWSVVQLLKETGRFHAVCRQSAGALAYRFEPLPASEETVGEFFEMSHHRELCGIQTSRRSSFDQLLCPLRSPRLCVDCLTPVDSLGVRCVLGGEKNHKGH